MTSSTQKQLYIGEGFEGPGVNLAHINVLVGPRNGPAGQAFSTALATPSA
ncbi:formaldehyde-activating enzyme, partial [Klebsiella pneumoniae]